MPASPANRRQPKAQGVLKDVGPKAFYCGMVGLRGLRHTPSIRDRPVFKRGQPRHGTVEAARTRFVFTRNAGRGDTVSRRNLKRFLDDPRKTLGRVSDTFDRGYFAIQ